MGPAEMSTTLATVHDSLPSNVPTLSAKGENWNIFQLRFTAAVQAKNRWSFFDGSNPRPTLTSPSTALVSELASWDRGEAVARHLLLSRIPDSLAIKVQRKGTVAEAWAYIVDDQTVKTAYAQTNMRQDFLDMKCGKQQKVAEFLDQMSVRIEELATLGVDIDKQDYMQTILKGIPQHLQSFTSGLLAAAKLTGTTVKVDVLAKAIADKANRTEKKSGNTVEKEEGDVAASASSSRGGGKKKGDDKKKTCWGCGGVGHFKRDCKKGDSDKAGKGKEKESAALVESVDTDSDWEADSEGAFGVNKTASESGMTSREMPDFVEGSEVMTTAPTCSLKSAMMSTGGTKVKGPHRLTGMISNHLSNVPSLARTSRVRRSTRRT